MQSRQLSTRQSQHAGYVRSRHTAVTRDGSMLLIRVPAHHPFHCTASLRFVASAIGSQRQPTPIKIGDRVICHLICVTLTALPAPETCAAQCHFSNRRLRFISNVDPRRGTHVLRTKKTEVAPFLRPFLRRFLRHFFRQFPETCAKKHPAGALAELERPMCAARIFPDATLPSRPEVPSQSRASSSSAATCAP